MSPTSFLPPLSRRCLAGAVLAGLSLGAAAQTATPARKAAAAPVPVSASAPAPAAQAMLRIACEGANLNAEVTLNGVFKGECPFDLSVAEGTWTLRAVKRQGAERERVFETQFRIVAGTAKRLEVELGEPQWTAEGQRLETERLQREDAEKRQRAEAQRRADAEREAAQAAAEQAAEERARARVQPVAEAVLAAQRGRLGATLPHCPDCPGPVPLSLSISMETAQPADEGLRQWLRQGRQQAEQFIAQGQRGDGFLPPATALELPCASADLAMRRLTGFVHRSEHTPEEQTAVRAAMAGIKNPPLNFLMDLRVWPVRAACDAAGQLDGPVDFWVYGARVIAADSHVMVIPSMARFQGTLAAGKPVGERITFHRTGTSPTRYMDPATEAMMQGKNDKRTGSAIWTYGDGAVAGRSLSVTLMLFEDSSVQKFGGNQSLKASFTLPVSADRTETLDYEGMRLSMRRGALNGKQHGAMTMYGHTLPVGPLTPDIKVPTTVLCFKDGKKVEMSPCQVD